MTTKIIVGNSAPHEALPHDSSDPAHAARLEARGGRVQDGFHLAPLDPTVSNQTEIFFPDGEPLDHLLPTVKDLWVRHSAAPGGWVLVEDEDEAHGALVKALLESHFGVRTPAPDEMTALVTNAGLDYIAKQLGGTASATAIALNMALTANATAAAAGDTVLTGEIVTAGGGLLRAAATYAHTASATTYTLTKTFTANGSDALPVTIAKIGIFDAASAGNMVFETLLSATATLSASGDTLTVTETVTI